ncbi:hypothetical protein NKDENANG_00167 [Candidatus Entotheonellaceae bacterium PAL068K]
MHELSTFIKKTVQGFNGHKFSRCGTGRNALATARCQIGQNIFMAESRKTPPGALLHDGTEAPDVCHIRHQRVL